MQPPPVPSKDAEHLRTLSICHYVVAGLSLFGIGFLFLHYMIMKTVLTNPEMWKNAKEPMPFSPQEFFGWFQWFYLIMGVFILASGVLTLMSGRFLGRRVKRTFSLVIAGLNCLFFPFGTVLGVFTLIVLTKESVMRLYAEAESSVN
jgi:hypothetical protein